MNTPTNNLIKAITLVNEYDPETIVSEAKSVDMYGRLFIVRGVRYAYTTRYIVHAEKNLMFVANVPTVDDERAIALAKLQWPSFD